MTESLPGGSAGPSPPRNIPHLRVEPLDAEALTPTQREQLPRLARSHCAGDAPGDPLPDRARVEAYLRESSARQRWAVWDGATSLGWAERHPEDGPIAGELDRFVHPAHRRHGIATALLAALAPHLTVEAKASLRVTLLDGIGGASAWCESLRGRLLETTAILEWRRANHHSRAADPALAHLRGRLAGVGVCADDGDLSPDRLAAVVRLLGRLRRSIDGGRLEADEEISVADLRAHFDEQRARRTPTALRTAWAQGDRCVGLTTVAWDDETPAQVSLFLTGVDPDDRRRGLGRLLKAMQLRQLFEAGVEVLRPRNDPDGVAICALNQQLGFRLCQTRRLWGLSVAALRGFAADRIVRPRGAPAAAP